ncbi:nagb/rpia/CoA transferase-like protein [Bimuria novae-zelandiae CBS 107.79]|uniref:Nagb/rpia/CoA transferase-like protein n=1 Tax=Bimuria novae-zelandiae CBS 107.79 TaxID=1447943 RepID=A0A6A5VKW4_9PLEO|nr:nagb/rpia/CoA transferase-like protein [Bimuria novae-zelandiae CBS 107.79]
MDYSSFASLPPVSSYRANIMGPTKALEAHSPSFSQPQPLSYRHSSAVPPRSSGLMATAASNANSFALNSMALELPDLEPIPKVTDKEKHRRWALFKGKMGRQRASRSISSVPSSKSLTRISETDSERYSIQVSYAPSVTTEEPLLVARENTEYGEQLEAAVERLKDDFVSGAREMADSVLSTLSSLIVTAASTAQSRDELWSMAVSAAKELSEARPSMNAAVTSCLLRALDEIKHLWEMLDENKNKSTNDLAAMSRRQLVRIVEKRKEAGIRLSENFAERLRAYCRQRLNNTHALTILTLSNSSTIRASILTTLTTLRFLHLHLLILESRPRFEGANLALQILSSTSAEARARLHIRILPDCAVATAAKDANLLLLGADRISASGDVSNKIGSMAAALCIKTLNPKAQVVVVSDADKIVGKGVEKREKELHPHSELTEAWGDEIRRELGARVDSGGVEVFGEWFEWVPAEYVDGYVTEDGTLDTAGVEKIADEVGELRERIFA